MVDSTALRNVFMTTLLIGLSFLAYSPIQANDIFVADGRNIIKVHSETGHQSVVSSWGNLDGLWGIAISQGMLYCTSTTRNSVIGVNPETTEQVVVSTGDKLVNPHGIVIDSHGNIYVASFGSDEIVRIDAMTRQQTVFASGGYLLRPTGITIDGDGHVLVIVGFLPVFSLIRIDLNNGNQEVVTQGGLLRQPTSLAVERTGDILVADADRIIRVAAKDGTQSLVSLGHYFSRLSGIAVEDTRDILVVDRGSFESDVKRIIRVYSDGQIQTVSQNQNLSTPKSLVWVLASDPRPLPVPDNLRTR